MASAAGICLSLRALEFRLSNRQYASRSIDILATDRFSATVIFGIKNSNQIVHPTLHKLFKSMPLIEHGHGLRDS